MMLTYQRFTALLLLIYGSLFLSGIYYCLRVFWCAAARMSELELEQRIFLAIKQITVLEHSAYSPDLAPSDFFLFPKIKEILK